MAHDVANIDFFRKLYTSYFMSQNMHRYNARNSSFYLKHAWLRSIFPFVALCISEYTYFPNLMKIIELKYIEESNRYKYVHSKTEI